MHIMYETFYTTLTSPCGAFGTVESPTYSIRRPRKNLRYLRKRKVPAVRTKRVLRHPKPQRYFKIATVKGVDHKNRSIDLEILPEHVSTAICVCKSPCN